MVKEDMGPVGEAVVLVASCTPPRVVKMLNPQADPIGLRLLAILGTANAVLIFGFARLQAALRARGLSR